MIGRKGLPLVNCRGSNNDIISFKPSLHLEMIYGTFRHDHQSMTLIEHIEFPITIFFVFDKIIRKTQLCSSLEFLTTGFKSGSSDDTGLGEAYC